MSLIALVFALLAAVMHAVWNALLKRSRHQFEYLWLIITLGGIAGAPVLVYYIAQGQLGENFWWWLLATVVLHTAYLQFLVASYRLGDLSFAYPIGRGLSVALVPIIAALAYDEQPSLAGGIGIATVALGIFAVGWPGQRASWQPGHFRALAASTGAGVMISICAVVDKAAVMQVNVVPYLIALFVGMGLLSAPIALRNSTGVLSLLSGYRPALIAGTLLCSVTYLLVLFAFQLSTAGYVVAARDCSIAVAALIGWLILKERATPMRVTGVVLIVAGIIAIALGG